MTVPGFKAESVIDDNKISEQSRFSNVNNFSGTYRGNICSGNYKVINAVKSVGIVAVVRDSEMSEAEIVCRNSTVIVCIVNEFFSKIFRAFIFRGYAGYKIAIFLQCGFGT